MHKPASFSLTEQADGRRFGLTANQGHAQHEQIDTISSDTHDQSPISARNAVKDVARVLAPSLFMLVFAVAAHAQGGTIDFTPVTTVGRSIVTILEFVGGAMAVGGLIFAAFEWFGRHDVSKAAGGLVGAIVGGVIVGAAATWGGSLTGQVVQ